MTELKSTPVVTPIPSHHGTGPWSQGIFYFGEKYPLKRYPPFANKDNYKRTIAKGYPLTQYLQVLLPSLSGL
jgi:hypothetical protein